MDLQCYVLIMKRFILILLFIFVLVSLSAQEIDTVRLTPSSYTGFILPTLFITYGSVAKHQKILRQIDIKVHEEVIERQRKKYTIDNYIQYTPVIAVYGLDFMGVKAKHNVMDRAFITVSSYMLSFATVQILKNNTNIMRPDDTNPHSFPSGHTATAFTGAHLLFKEYKDTSIWIGIAGYTIAGCTGAMRIYNKKHWFSDVVAGMGIGIMSVEISYLLLPLYDKLSGKTDAQRKIFVAPSIHTDNYGVGIAYSF